MAVLNILQFPDPRLRTVAKPVPTVDRALRALIDDPARRRRLGRAGRTSAEAEFGIERVTERTLAMYGALLTA